MRAISSASSRSSTRLTRWKCWTSRSKPTIGITCLWMMPATAGRKRHMERCPRRRSNGTRITAWLALDGRFAQSLFQLLLHRNSVNLKVRSPSACHLSTKGFAGPFCPCWHCFSLAGFFAMGLQCQAGFASAHVSQAFTCQAWFWWRSGGVACILPQVLMEFQ